MNQKKQKKDKARPSSIIWFIYYVASLIIMKFKNGLKIDRKAYKNRNKKEGSIIIYNHTSKYDHFITTAAIGPKPASYVISTHFFFNKLLKFIFKLVNGIPKEQFKSDVSTIKRIKRSLQSKISVAIAPAGQITLHGDQLLIDKSIVKLLKMCAVDVYAIQIHGGYFAYPKWRKYPRKLKIRTNIVKVFSKEDLKELSDEEIYQKTCESINVNDRLEQEKYNYKLKSKGLVEGLEGVLYYCPKCKSKNTIETLGNKIYCNSCNNAMIMNSKGYFEAISDNTVIMNNEAEWYKFQKEFIINDIQENKLHIEGKFKLFRNLDAQYELVEAGEGKVVLTCDELYYQGTVRGEEIKKNFKLEVLTQLPFDPSDHFDIPDDEGYFEFKLVEGENPNIVIQFVQAIETLYTYRRGL